MINSRAMITYTIHVASFPNELKQINAEHTNNLSANGSINFPKFVTRLCFLARCPSKKSVKLAIQKSAKAMYLLAAPPKFGIKINNTKNGTIITLKTVNLFGKFMILTLLSNHILMHRLFLLLQNLPTLVPHWFLRR